MSDDDDGWEEVVSKKKDKKGKVTKRRDNDKANRTKSSSKRPSKAVEDAHVGEPNDALKAQWKKEQFRLQKLMVRNDSFQWKVPDPMAMVAANKKKGSRRTGPENSTTKGETPVAKRDPSELSLIAGVDISFVDGSEVDACAALVVLTFPDFEVVYEDYQMVKLEQPYIPGFLAFREVSFLVDLIAKLRATRPELEPQVVVVDGNGTLHYTGFGLACHLGVLIDLPTIGVGKNLLCVDGLRNEDVLPMCKKYLQKAGEHIELKGDSGRVWGAALRPTEKGFKPIYVSQGHRISLESAVSVVQSCCIHRIPEPVRRADLGSRAVVRERMPSAEAKGAVAVDTTVPVWPKVKSKADMAREIWGNEKKVTSASPTPPTGTAQVAEQKQAGHTKTAVECITYPLPSPDWFSQGKERPVMLMGEPVLRQIAQAVTDTTDPTFRQNAANLVATLDAFRKKWGFGRGIAAPQIGVSQRFIALNLGKGPFLLVNPVIVWRSKETLTLWDDCMSHPDLLALRTRNSSISVDYIDETGTPRRIDECPKDLAELLQHEMEHLDGVLSAELAGPRGLLLREVYEKNVDFYHKQVSYFIVPTIDGVAPQSAQQNGEHAATEQVTKTKPKEVLPQGSQPQKEESQDSAAAAPGWGTSVW